MKPVDFLFKQSLPTNNSEKILIYSRKLKHVLKCINKFKSSWLHLLERKFNLVTQWAPSNKHIIIARSLARSLQLLNVPVNWPQNYLKSTETILHTRQNS